MIPLINVHSYIIPNLVDEAVMKKEAEYRRDRRGETTVIHRHQEDGTPTLAGCTTDCTIYEPGYKTRPVGASRSEYKIEEAG